MNSPLKGTTTMQRLGRHDAERGRPAVFTFEDGKPVVSKDVGPTADLEFLAAIPEDDRAAYIKGYKGEKS